MEGGCVFRGKVLKNTLPLLYCSTSVPRIWTGIQPPRMRGHFLRVGTASADPAEGQAWRCDCQTRPLRGASVHCGGQRAGLGTKY